MNDHMIYVSVCDYQKKCKAEAELEVVKRYLVANNQYGSFNDLRVILGMEKKDD